MTGTIIMLGTVTVACAVIEKVLMETSKASWAPYVSLVGITTISITAIKAVMELFTIIKGM